MKMPLICVAVIAATSGAAAHANCYTVYGRGDVLFQSINTPVDLSRNLSDTVPTRFGPGTTLVIWSNDDGCVEVAGPGTYSMGGGMPRPSSAPSISNTSSVGAPRKTPNDAPANLDRFFKGQDNQMRGSVGVTSDKAGTTAHMGPNGAR